MGFCRNHKSHLASSRKALHHQVAQLASSLRFEHVQEFIILKNQASLEREENNWTRHHVREAKKWRSKRSILCRVSMLQDGSDSFRWDSFQSFLSLLSSSFVCLWIASKPTPCLKPCFHSTPTACFRWQMKTHLWQNSDWNFIWKFTFKSWSWVWLKIEITLRVGKNLEENLSKLIAAQLFRRFLFFLNEFSENNYF